MTLGSGSIVALTIVAALVSACGQSSDAPDDAPVGDAATAQQWLDLEPAELLAPRGTATWPDGRAATTELVTAGTLEFPSGEVMIFEPGWVELDAREDVVFARDVGPEAEVLVNLVRTGVTTRAAAAVLVFGDLQGVTWTRASLPEKDAVLSVDAGMGGFADAGDLDAVQEAMADEDAYLRLTEEVIAEGFARAPGPSVALDSGMGDGAYEVWIGHGPSNRIHAVLVDFELLHHAAAYEPEA